MEIKQTTKMMRKGVNHLFLIVMASFILIPAIILAADSLGILDGCSGGFVYANGIQTTYITIN